MTKHRNGRYTKRTEAIDPYYNLACDIIIDAILIASGQSPADDKSRAEAKLWLQGETCQRWSDAIGVNIGAALEHPDCLMRKELK